VARGLSPEDARWAAHRKLGNAARVREEIYQANTVGWLESVPADGLGRRRPQSPYQVVLAACESREREAPLSGRRLTYLIE
jgi:hypothetical protein